jgi:hypothetical protein
MIRLSLFAVVHSSAVARTGSDSPAADLNAKARTSRSRPRMTSSTTREIVAVQIVR